MTSIRAGSKIIVHPDYELICQIMQLIEQHDQEMQIPLFWFLVILLLEADEALDDLPNGDGTLIGDDEEAERRRRWTAWRKKVRKEFGRQLRKKGFKKNVIRQIIEDYLKAALPPNPWKMMKFVAKWLWALKKVLDAYKAAKDKVGPPPDNSPPPPEDIDMDEVPDLHDLLFEETETA